MRRAAGEAIGRLPALFTGFALAHFGLGALLGAWMALRPALIPLLRPLHEVINPWGWLTFLIYGITYAMLALLLGRQPPWPWLGRLHLAVAEAGLWALVAADVGSSPVLVAAGLALQAAGPLLFLLNLLGTLLFGPRLDREGLAMAASRELEREAEREAQAAARGRRRPALRPAPWIHLLARSEVARSTDPVGRRGTELAVLALLAAAALEAGPLRGTTALPLPYVASPAGALLLRYGWIAGTLLAVPLHLLPRWLAYGAVRRRGGELAQLLWLLGLAGAAAGFARGAWTLASAASRLLGLAFLYAAALYLAPGRRLRRLGPPLAFAWRAGWSFAALLGLGLLLGLDPLSPLATHLALLGWATTVAYGVGYALFPLFLDRRPRAVGISLLQLGLAVAGAASMAAGFLALGSGGGLGRFLPGEGLLGAGGAMAATAALLYGFLWLFGRVREREPSFPPEPEEPGGAGAFPDGAEE
ncbi:MAG: hypothetical protein QJR08_02280 [Bacillota bacterium]|nr:hypothetical protein [Bacillota bacterium]